MNKQGKYKKHSGKLWLAIILTLLILLVLVTYILWCQDVGPVERDYTGADLRQAAAGSEGSYEFWDEDKEFEMMNVTFEINAEVLGIKDK